MRGVTRHAMLPSSDATRRYALRHRVWQTKLGSQRHGQLERTLIAGDRGEIDFRWCRVNICAVAGAVKLTGVPIDECRQTRASDHRNHLL